MPKTSFIRRCLTGCLLLPILTGFSAWAQPEFTRETDIVYTQRHGHDLSMEVIRPKEQSGAGVLFMVSGSWKSRNGGFQLWMSAPFLEQGLTVFAVSHLAQPQASVQEIVEDVNRAARFVRHHAKEYGVAPERLGVFGASSGGHLSLMLATRGGPGDSKAEDPIARESSAVQAAAVFFPVTDLLNLGPSTENLGDGGPPKNYRKAFGPDAGDLEKWKVIGGELSPILHIGKDLPPIFITHGDKDTLVPLEQSTRFKEKAAELGHDIKLTISPGNGHGWAAMLYDTQLMSKWLAEQLKQRN